MQCMRENIEFQINAAISFYQETNLRCCSAGPSNLLECGVLPLTTYAYVLTPLVPVFTFCVNYYSILGIECGQVLASGLVCVYYSCTIITSVWLIVCCH